MASYTPNYNLKKPADSDSYDIADHNGNMDKIDTELNTLNSKISDLRDYGDINACASLDAVKSTLSSLISSMSDGTKKIAYIRATASFDLFVSGITYLVELSRYSINYANANIQQLAGDAFILGMYAGSWTFTDLVTRNGLNNYIYAVSVTISLGNIAANNYKDGYVDIDTPSGYSHLILIPQYTSVGMPIAGTYVSSGAPAGKTRITAGVNNTKHETLSGVTVTIRAVFYM